MDNNKLLNQISVLAFLFVGVIITVNLFTTQKYGRANTQVAEILKEQGHLANYALLHAITNHETDQYQLIDLRSAEEFNSGHLEGAINIPFQQLLESSSLKSIRNGGKKIPVLYAGSESTAHSARVLLLSKGLTDQIMVLGGNYQKAVEYALDDFKPEYANYKEEKAQFDYKRLMNNGSTPTRERAPLPPGVVPVKTVTTSAAGGC